MAIYRPVAHLFRREGRDGEGLEGAAAVVHNRCHPLGPR